MPSGGTGTMAWLQGRQLGLHPPLGHSDRLSHSLYSSIDVCSTWDPTTSSAHGSYGGIFNFDFSTDGAMLVAACEKKSFLVFDPHNCRLVRARRRAHSDCVNCVRFLDTRTFVTCSDDHTVALWDLRFLKNQVYKFVGHSNWVKNIEYASSLGLLITSGFDGSVYAWNVNNYSKDQEPRRLFYLEGLMRCKLTPDESKLVLSTSRGYLLIVHDLDLSRLNVNMDQFNAPGASGPRMRVIASNFCGLFERSKNRLEIVNDFPEEDKADNISSLQVHPQGWCVVSRNTSRDESTEWTCVHDIHTSSAMQAHPEEERQKENEDDTPEDSPLTSARTRRWCSGSRCHRSRVPNNVQTSDSSHGREISSSDEEGEDRQDPSARNASDSNSNHGEGGDESVHRPRTSRTVSSDSASLYSYFLWAQRAHPSRMVSGLWADPFLDRSDSDGEDENELTLYHRQQQHIINQALHRARLRRGGVNTWDFRNLIYGNNRHQPSQDNHGYRSHPRLIYSLQERNVGRGFIKEQCFSTDGRIVVSPCANGVRLLSFDPLCRELCDCEPPVARQVRSLNVVKELYTHPDVVLTTRFSPTHPLFVSGSLDGCVMFMSPSL